MGLNPGPTLLFLPSSPLDSSLCPLLGPGSLVSFYCLRDLDCHWIPVLFQRKATLLFLTRLASGEVGSGS